MLGMRRRIQVGDFLNIQKYAIKEPVLLFCGLIVIHRGILKMQWYSITYTYS